MVLSLKHAFQSEKADGSDATIIRPSNWNEEHALTTAADTLLGRASGGAGPAQEIICTSFARSMLDDTDAITARTTLDAAKAATISTSAPSGGADGDVWYVVAGTIDTTAPIITSPSIKTVTTNTPLAMMLTANEPVTWSLGTFADSAQFEISGTTLRWVGNGTKNFSSPTDSDANNTYLVQVYATDLASNVTSQTIIVSVVATPDVTAPTITSAATKSVAENATLTHFVTANETVFWAISGGPDAAKFELSGTMLRWAGNGTKDFEAPDDANTDNVYIVQVTATDGAGNSSDQTISVTVTNVAEGTDTTPPVINTSATQTVAENSVLAVALAADETVTWTITGGADASRFEISGTTLRWVGNGTKDFEAPNDADANNVYVVQITATDPASNATNKNISVTVTDVGEGVGTWTPASLSGTVHFFSAPLAVTQSGGIVSAVPDRNGGSDWVPSGLGDDGAGTQPLSYGATSFGGAPGFTTLGGRGLRYAGVTGSTAVWTFFARVNLDSTYAIGKRIWSAAPSGGFQDFGNDGATFVSNGGGTDLGTDVLQDGVEMNVVRMSYDVAHTLILACSGSSVAVYVDGVLATAVPTSGFANPSTPPSSPWTLGSTLNIGCFIRGESLNGNANGAKGLFQSGGFKIGGTALNSTDIANLHAWMMDPV